MSEADAYPLGHSEHEAKRLADQAAKVGRLTETLFLRAGLRPGMQVLDIGSGVGDVALLAARIVGPEGAVLGVERAASSIATARRRVAELGAANVVFEQADLADFTTDRAFDAIVGRFVLSYVPDRSAVLRRLARFLKPGGIVAFQEIDMDQIAQIPPSEEFTRVRRWVLEAFAAGGTTLDMGSRLYATMVQAGLPPPEITAVFPVAGGPGCPGYAELEKILHSLLPVIEREGIAPAADIVLEGLAERLRADAAANDRVIFMSRIVEAWTRID